MTEQKKMERIRELRKELAALQGEVQNDWHSWFLALLNMKLYPYLDHITIEAEHVLGVEPPRADFLILTEQDKIDLGLEVFDIFRKHNIIEFKNPGDLLGMRTMWKVVGYAGFYISQAAHDEDIPAEEVTLSIFRGAKPIKFFKEMGEHIKKGSAKGIYMVEGIVPMPFQIVVTSELEGSEYAGFRAISMKPRKEDVQQVLVDSGAEREHFVREQYKAFMEMLNKKDPVIVESIRKEKDMASTWMDIFKEEIDEKVNTAVSAAVDTTTRKNLFEYVCEGGMSVDFAAKKANQNVEDFVKDMKEHGYQLP